MTNAERKEIRQRIALLERASALFDRFGVLFHTADTHAYILKSLLELIDQRHAGFNDTLYQLEPDVKEAPGALRDLTATRTIAMLTDPLLLRRGPADPARFDALEDRLDGAADGV